MLKPFVALGALCRIIKSAVARGNASVRSDRRDRNPTRQDQYLGAARRTAVMIVVYLAVALVPLAAFALDAEIVSEGSGSSLDQELRWLLLVP